MAQIIPKIKVKSGETIGNEIFIGFPELDTDYTFLTADATAAASSFSVDNGLKFIIGIYEPFYCIVGSPGNEKTEILRTHDSTSPTATTITLNGTTSSFAHNRGDTIRLIPFNQIVIESSTDNVSFSVLDTIAIAPDSLETYYNHKAGTITTYYRVRFKNSTDTSYSIYSDSIIATGYTANSAGQLIKTALSDLGETFDTLITKEYLFGALNEGRREIDEDQNVIRWSFRVATNYNAYSIIPGQYKIPVPTDLRDPATNQNILNIRFGKNQYPCRYIGQTDFWKLYQNVYHTTLNGALLTGDTSIVLTDSGDFGDSGDISIAAEAVDEVLDVVSYTANNVATQTLSGVTGIRAAGHATAIDVWQNVTFGTPMYYTVIDGYIYFSQPFSDDLAGENVYIDYYKVLNDINSDADILDEPFYKIFVPYLRFKIKLKKDPGLDWQKDIDFVKWESHKKAQIAKQYLGQEITITIN